MPYQHHTSSNLYVATTDYNGLIITSINPKLQKTITTKNSQGKVISVEDADTFVMKYTYDANGNLTTTTDAAGNVTTMSYDIRGRKTGMVDPDMGRWSYEYDALGNLIRQTDAKAQVTTMAYDLLGRMTSRTEPEGISSWTYDTQWVGALSSESGGIASKAYVYDTYGRVKASNTTINGQLYIVLTNYDGLGRVDTITYPNGVAVRHNYNTSHYFESVSNVNTGAVIWQANAMDQFGHLTSESFNNSKVTTNHNYHPVRGTLTGLSSVSGGTTIQNWSYDYDPIGNMKFRTDAVVGYTENFQYDNLNRLTHVRDAGGVLQKQYDYDEIGNIKSKSDVGAYAYDPFHPHAVQTAGGNSYSYDANGNMKGGAGRTLSWTSFNKPLGITTANGYSGYAYDAGHNRVQKTTQTMETTYIGKIYEQQRDILTGITKQVANIYAGSKLVASISDVSGIVSTRYMHGDHLGSISVITDETGAVVERLRFDVFGLPVDPATDAAKAMGASNTTRGFTGHEMDASTGLINMNARLYDPILGRFISADAVVPGAGNMQAFNRYSYVVNNPLMYTDPTGHFFGIDDLLFIAIVGAIAGGANAAMNGGGFMDIVLGAAIGGIAAYAGGSAGLWAGELAGGGLGGFIAGSIAGGIAGGVVGAAMGTAFYGGDMIANVRNAFVSGAATGFASAMFGQWAGAYVAGYWQGGADDARRALGQSLKNTFITAAAAMTARVAIDYISSDVAATGREMSGAAGKSSGNANGDTTSTRGRRLPKDSLAYETLLKDGTVTKEMLDNTWLYPNSKKVPSLNNS